MKTKATIICQWFFTTSDGLQKVIGANICISSKTPPDNTKLLTIKVGLKISINLLVFLRQLNLLLLHC